MKIKRGKTIINSDLRKYFNMFFTRNKTGVELQAFFDYKIENTKEILFTY